MLLYYQLCHTIIVELNTPQIIVQIKTIIITTQRIIHESMSFIQMETQLSYL